MKIWHFCLLLLGVGLLLFSVGCAPETSEADQESEEIEEVGEKTDVEELVLRSATDASGDEWIHIFKQELEKHSDGKITVDNYPGGQLGSFSDMLDQTRDGSLDFYMHGSEVATVVDDFLFFDLPFLFEDRDQAFNSITGTVGKKIAEKFPERNLRVLTFLDAGFRQITNSARPIVTPSDLEGLRIRTPVTDLRVKTFETFGAMATPMDVSELYTALSQGAVDGQENPLFIIKLFSFYEVQDYLSLSNHVYSVNGIVMNEDKWQELSTEQQNIIKAAAEESAKIIYQENVDEDNERLEYLKEMGLQVNEVDYEAFVEIVEPIWDEYRDQWAEYLDIIE